MKILVCAATQNEFNACVRGIKRSRNEKFFEVLKTGVGFFNAKHSLKNRLLQGPKVDLVVSTGFAGSMNNHVALGCWISSDKIFLEETAELKPREILFSKIKFHDPETVSVPLISTNRLIISDVEKQSLENMVVDMESAVLAEVCNEFKVSYLVLRYISDSPEEPLPSFVKEIASAMAEQKIAKKLKYLTNGILKATKDLSGVRKIIKSSQKWDEEFMMGWSRRAPLILNQFQAQK